MLRVSPSQKAMQDSISALQMQIQSLSGDPQAIADLTSKLATMQAAADGYPAIQSALSAVQSQVNGISVPDVSGLATKTALTAVESKIPSISGLATTSALTAVSDRVNAITVPDVSGLATKSALSTVEAKIPSIAGLATNASVSSLSTRIDGLSIPDVSGLATKSALSTVEAKIPSIAGLATQSALSAVEAKIPSIAGLATQSALDSLAAKTAVVLDGSFTVDTLPTPSAQYLDKYARVTDLFGAKRDLVLCSMVDSTYFWQPVRKEYAKTLSLTTDVTLTTLKSPTIILAAGTLLANRTINLSNTYAYPGSSFEVGFDGNLGLFGITIKNSLGATLGSLLAGGRKRYFFADGAWQNF